MALRDSNHKFVERFTKMEQLAREQDKDFASLPLEEQDALWNQVKAEESRTGIDSERLKRGTTQNWVKG